MQESHETMGKKCHTALGDGIVICRQCHPGNALSTPNMIRKTAEQKEIPSLDSNSGLLSGPGGRKHSSIAATYVTKS